MPQTFFEFLAQHMLGFRSPQEISNQTCRSISPPPKQCLVLNSARVTSTKQRQRNLNKLVDSFSTSVQAKSVDSVSVAVRVWWILKYLLLAVGKVSACKIFEVMCSVVCVR